ncbi:Glycosyltransferase involved in cell wall bisynthesis [Brevibacterium sp. 239c]|uniref:glycosyltransferase n=1 Tax=Brevibacterium sp. 239c TaxID=1965356 RepID=UPI000C45B084|nr:glycosyltransferase [Brevibacterium sp. 239c]SMY03710.1 Glycosyltransferase involved in cell wall bisynthesis [Brevibacterium sp. 239c]
MKPISRLLRKDVDHDHFAIGPVAGFDTDALHVYNAIWGIPDSIGGMTTAALRRIRSFQKYGSPLSQTLLTFSPRMDVDATRTRLISEGRMDESVELVNIWQDLRGRSDVELAALGGKTPTDPVPEVDGEVESITEFYDVFRNSSSTGVVRRNYLRPDNTLLLTDVHDPKLGRRFVLYSAGGNPIAEWNRPRDFYNAWITATITEEPSVLIVDDKKISEFIHEITERTFALILFLHGTHLRHPWNGAHGEFLPRRVETMRNFDRFDAVGVQTKQQADAIAAKGISGANIKLLTGELPVGSVQDEAQADRSTNNAVMIANLIPLKRVDHAIRVVSLLKGRGVDVSLTVLGEGTEREKLEHLIADLGVEDRVRLPGYVNDVPARLQSASFSMLTSTSEGLPLAMMESMGAGCVPIVYDITYGPRDLVIQGQNGFITPLGDIEALATQIEEFVGLGSERVTTMREAAKETVKQYLPEAGYRRWKTVLEGLSPVLLPNVDPRESGQAISAKSLRVAPTVDGARIELELSQTHESIAASLQLVLAARKKNTYFLCTDPSIKRRPFGRGAIITFDIDEGKFSESKDETFDVYLRRPHDPWNGKRRIRPLKSYTAESTGRREWYSTRLGNLSVRRLAMV